MRYYNVVRSEDNMYETTLDRHPELRGPQFKTLSLIVSIFLVLYLSHRCYSWFEIETPGLEIKVVIRERVIHNQCEPLPPWMTDVAQCGICILITWE